MGPFWDKNLKLLRKNFPHLDLHEIEDMAQQEKISVEVLNTPSGDYSLSVRHHLLDEPVLLHSRMGPREEALETAKKLELKPGEVRVLMGMGLGYLAMALIAKAPPKWKLIIVEPSHQIFLHALNYCDLGPLLSHPEVVFLLGKGCRVRGQLHRYQKNVLHSDVKITYFEPERTLYPEFFRDCAQRIKDEFMDVKITVQSMNTVGKAVFFNTLNNLPAIVESINAAALNGAFKDRPCIVVGAGPSLTDQISVLQRHRKKLLIIAVDSASPVLLRAGVIPDIVTAVDYSPLCYEKIRPVVEQTDGLTFCYVPGVNPLILKSIRSPLKMFLPNPLSTVDAMRAYWDCNWALLRDIRGVSHLAITLAASTEANPVILLGFDLAYTRLSSHARGMAIPISFNLATSSWIKDIDGGMSPTLPQMVSDRIIIEQLIKEFHIQCFNANTSGAVIEGAPQCNLEELLEKIEMPQRSSSDVIKELFQAVKRPTPGDVLNFLSHQKKNAEKGTKLLERTIKSAKKAKKKLNKVMCLDRDYRKYPEGVLRATKAAVADFSKATRFLDAIRLSDLKQYLSFAELSIGASEEKMNIEMADASTGEKAIKEMELIEEACSLYMEGLKLYEAELAKLKKRFKKEREFFEWRSKNEQSNMLRRGLDHARFLMENGDLFKAEMLVRDVLESFPDSKEAILVLGQILCRQKRYEKAYECFELIKSSQNPDPELLEIIEKTESEWVTSNIISSRKIIDTWDDSRVFSHLPIAQKWLEEVLHFHPDNEEAKRLLEKCEGLLRTSEERNEFLKKIVMASEEECLNALVDLVEGHDMERASVVAEILLKRFPGSAIVREILSDIYREQGRTREAEDLLVQAMGIAPGRPQSLIRLGILMARAGREPEAIEHFLEALKMDETGLGHLHETIAHLLFQTGRYQEAISHYEKFFIANPQRREILINIAECHERLGNLEAAAQARRFAGQ